jgi:hypothetical protein
MILFVVNDYFMLNPTPTPTIYTCIHASNTNTYLKYTRAPQIHTYTKAHQYIHTHTRIKYEYMYIPQIHTCTTNTHVHKGTSIHTYAHTQA